QAAPAHIASPHELRWESKTGTEDFLENRCVLARSNAAQQDHLTLGIHARRKLQRRPLQRFAIGSFLRIDPQTCHRRKPLGRDQGGSRYETLPADDEDAIRIRESI